MAYSVYSMPDISVNMNHPDVGAMALHECGLNKITVSASGDLSSHTTTSDGYVVVNRIRATNGRVDIEVAQNSKADYYLRNWTAWARNKNTPTNRIAMGVMTIHDSQSAKMITASNLSVLKVPDRTYDKTSTNVTYSFLSVSITESAVTQNTITNYATR